jgi:hypothetical protein
MKVVFPLIIAIGCSTASALARADSPSDNMPLACMPTSCKQETSCCNRCTDVFGVWSSQDFVETHQGAKSRTATLTDENG